MSDFERLAGQLAKIGAPILGGIIGGPAGAAATAVLATLAEALGTAPTPDAVTSRIEADPDTAKGAVAPLEARAKSAAEVALEDRQGARFQTVELVRQGSAIAWGAPVVSAIVLAGFGVLSYLAIYADQGQREVLLFLLGNWSGLATAVVAYWVGSSAGSKAKDDTLASVLAGAAAPVGKAVGQAIKRAAK